MKTLNHDKIIRAGEPTSRARYLLREYFRKTASRAERKELEAWTLASNEHMRIFEDWVDKEIADPTLKFLDEEPKVVVKKFPLWMIAAGVFGVIVVMSDPVLHFFNSDLKIKGATLLGDPPKTVSKKAVAPQGKSTMVILADSSKAILEGGSSVKSVLTPHNWRYAELEGSARFEINPGPERFCVYVKNYKIISSPGIFTINTSANSDLIQLSLSQGDLMFTVNKKNSWILKPGQSATYSKGVWTRIP